MLVITQVCEAGFDSDIFIYGGNSRPTQSKAYLKAKCIILSRAYIVDAIVGAMQSFTSIMFIIRLISLYSVKLLKCTYPALHKQTTFRSNFLQLPKPSSLVYNLFKFANVLLGREIHRVNFISQCWQHFALPKKLSAVFPILLYIEG